MSKLISFIASLWGFKDAVEILLSNGANFNATNKSGETALFLGK